MADRGVSDVIGFVLVFSLVVASVAVVSVSGVDTLQTARDAEQLENAERAFDVLADNVADLHRRGAPSRATEMSLGQAQLKTGDPIVMNVTVNETGAASPTPVLNRTARPIVYSGNRDRQLVYEAGAVFRVNRDGGLMTRQPPFVIADDRVLLSVLTIRSESTQSLGGSSVLVRTDHRGAAVRHASSDGSVQNVTIRVESPRASVWADYFEDSGFDCTTPGTAVSCQYNPAGGIERVYVVNHDVVVEIDE